MIASVLTATQGNVLPPFDSFGNLPGAAVDPRIDSSIHVGLAEVKARFVTNYPSSRTRPLIWDGWMQYRRAFEATGLPYAMLVNGSFVTDRLDPGDIDFCVLYESTALQALDAVVQSTVKHLFDLTDSLPRLRCHAFPLAIYPFTSIRFSAFVRDMAYWSRVFGVDRKGREKGFLHIGERGVI